MQNVFSFFCLFFATVGLLGLPYEMKIYYLTDLIQMFREDGLSVGVYVIDDPNEIANVNTQEELQRINSLE